MPDRLRHKLVEPNEEWPVPDSENVYCVQTKPAMTGNGLHVWWIEYNAEI
jgi:hypothetical protein